MSPFSIGAIVAALITGLVSLVGLVISKERKISELRQAWIDSLRSELASLVSYANAIHGASVAFGEVGSAAKAWEMVRADFVGINQAAASIRLRLNPDEEQAQAVLDKIVALEKMFLPGKPIDHLELGRVEKELVSEAQILLKHEWSRVKRGEVAYRIAITTAFLIVLGGLVALPILYFKIAGVGL